MLRVAIGLAFSVFLLLLQSIRVNAQTCEENNLNTVNYNRAACDQMETGCPGGVVTDFYMGPYYAAIPPGTTSFPTYIGCKQYDCNGNYMGIVNTGALPICQGSLAKSESPPPQCENIQSGSIVKTETQVLGESIPIVGVNFSMNYYTYWGKGFRRAYSVVVPIVPTPVPSTLTEVELKVESADGIYFQQSFNNSGNAFDYEYVWDGLDLSSNSHIGPRLFSITRTQFFGANSVPYTTPAVVGTFDAFQIGLGGWIPSVMAFYSPETERLYKSDGSVRIVTAKPWGSGQYLVAEEDGSLAYIFRSDGRHIYTKTGLTGTTIFTFQYDSAGRLESIVEPFGRSTIFQKNIMGDFEAIVAPKGQTTEVTLDNNGLLESLTNPNNEVFEMTYDGTTGLLETFTKPGGYTSTFQYEIDGRLKKDVHSGGFFFELIKNINANVTSDTNITSIMGRTKRVQSTYSEGANQKNTTFPSGRAESYSYAQYLNQTSNVYGVSQVSQFTDDPRFGNMSNLVYYFSQNSSKGTRSIWTSANVMLSNSSDPFSITSWYRSSILSGTNTSVSTTYNPSTKKFLSTSYLGRTEELEIDSYERIKSKKRGTLNPRIFTYTNERLTSINEGNRTTTLAYNSSSGYLQSITNSLNQTINFGFDSAGRIVSKTLPDSRVIGMSYDADGRIVSITPPGKLAHAFEFNSSELLESYSPPVLSGVSVVDTTYTYDLDKQLTQIVRPDGAVVSYNYNSSTGVLMSIGTPAGTWILSNNQTNDMPSSITKPDGTSLNLYYAGKEMTEVTTFYASPSLVAYYYPTFNSVALVESDTVQVSGISSSISYEYNEDEDLKRAGDIHLTYNTPSGLLTGTSLGSGVTGFTDSYGYNNYGELTSYEALRGTTSLYVMSITRDDLGRIISKSQTMNGVVESFVYSYDVAGRLTQVEKNGVIVAEYSYDSNSNRTGGYVGAQATTATYDSQDRLTSYNSLTFSYNQNGEMVSRTNGVTNTTATYAHDVFGNLETVNLPGGDVITYEIDGLGRRIGRKVNGVLEKRWVYMDQYRIAAEVNASGTITKRFVYGSKGNIPEYMIASGSKYRIISDQVGSLRLVVKQSDGTIAQRMNHDEFGRVTEDTNPGFLPFGFAGGLYDHDTGLVRFGARDYDPETGRWNSKDPILFNGKSTNLYGYVNENPVNFIDPKGTTPYFMCVISATYQCIHDVSASLNGGGSSAGGSGGAGAGASCKSGGNNSSDDSTPQWGNPIKGLECVERASAHCADSMYGSSGGGPQIPGMGI